MRRDQHEIDASPQYNMHHPHFDRFLLADHRIEQESQIEQVCIYSILHEADIVLKRHAKR